VKLVRADPLLRAAKKVRSLKPLVQRNVRGLENRSDANCELFPANTALLQAVTNDPFRVLLARLGAYTFQGIDAFFVAALRANRAIRPKQRLKTRKRCFFIVKVRLVKNRHHRNPLT